MLFLFVLTDSQVHKKIKMLLVSQMQNNFLQLLIAMIYGYNIYFLYKTYSPLEGRLFPFILLLHFISTHLYTNEISHWFGCFYDKKIYFMDSIQCLFLTHCFVFLSVICSYQTQYIDS